jgi:hypothetical protein
VSEHGGHSPVPESLQEISSGWLRVGEDDRLTGSGGKQPLQCIGLAVARGRARELA